MATFTVKIDTENDAFVGAFAKVTEVSRILKVTAKRIESGEASGKLWDVNGNTVGSFNMED